MISVRVADPTNREWLTRFIWATVSIHPEQYRVSAFEFTNSALVASHLSEITIIGIDFSEID